MGFRTMFSLWILVLVLGLPSLADALGFTPPKSLRSKLRRRTTAIVSPVPVGWVDFKPVHGPGFGGNKDAFDEQLEAQQAILCARQGQSKEQLKQKLHYKQNMSVNEPKDVAQNAVDDAIYFSD
jgi:hypothetical protein